MYMEVVEGFDLSPQQKHLWRLQRLNGTGPYRAQCGILIEGALDIEILDSALTSVAERHEIFRTTFPIFSNIEVPVQVIHESSGSRQNFLDLTGFDAQEQETRIDEIFDEMRDHHFDLERDPLIKLCLLRLTREKHLLLVNLPALCADAATLRNLMQETSLSYDALPDGRETESPTQYADIAAWQNDMLEAEYAAAGKEFWRSQVSSLIQTSRLPFELYRAENSEFVPRLITLTLDNDLREKIKAVASQHRTTSDTILSTCWQILLWRITGQTHLVIGVAHDGRNYAELKDVLGPLSKYLPIQTEMKEQMRFNAALKRTAQAFSEADKWQGCFSWELVAGTDTHTAAPFCQIAFDFEEQPPKSFVAGVSFSMNRRYTCADRFKIKLSCVLKEDTLRAEFHYDANLIPVEHVEGLAGQFRTLLMSALDNPEATLGTLDLLTEPERCQLVAAAQSAKVMQPTGHCVHELFEEQVQRRPERVALVFEDRQLTYAELNARANQLAHYLRAYGVGPEVRVAICVERSLEMLVAVLGVLKAGGAYVPLDAALPAERLAFMLEESHAKVLLSQQSLADSLPACRAKLVFLDSDWTTIAGQSEENPVPVATVENLVYVLFTSGSTGTPKGVCIEHRQLLNYLHAIVGELEVDADANFALVSTFAADLGNTVIFPSLCNGGCLHIISQERASDAVAIGDYFLRHRIDCLKIVPTHLAALLSASQPEQVLPRRQLVIGGEASKWELIEKIQLLAPDCAILNHYGPTETTVGVLTARVEKELQPRFSATIPIGRPLANTQAYLLDARLAPVPVWVGGELYIGGDSVSRGYLNQPGLTAERFVPNPFSETPGARLYKTGDLSRRLPDGRIEFLGRNDHQVKIRGFRIETGEIETVLNRHPEVSESVVVVREDLPDEKRLIAYLVLSQPQPPSTQQLRDHLKENLPSYMMPAVFVMLHSIPLTPNGKIDRSALPSPDAARQNEIEYIAPRNEVESILISAWQKVLNVAPVGVHDDYFALGGDSIRVIQIVHEVNCSNLSIRAVDIFQNPTVARLAKHIRQGRRDERANEPVPLELAGVPDHVRSQVRSSLPGGFEDVYPASKMQQFIVKHYAEDRQRLGVYHIQHDYHIYDEDLSLGAFKRALEMLVQAHTSLRTTFIVEENAEPLQVVHRQLPVSVTEVDLTTMTASEQEQHIKTAIEKDREHLFDVQKAAKPLFRFIIFVRSEKTFVFFMSMHHALSDGWGNRELTKELVRLYTSLKRGDHVEKTTPANEYKEFVALEREIIASDGARQFWSKHLTNHRHEALRIRTAKAEPSAETNYTGTLETALAASLHELSRSLRVSMKAILLGAYLDLIGGQTGQDQVTVGVISNGRSERLSNPLKAMGLFWNIIPFCCPANAVEKASHLKRVQQLLIDTEQYARYPLPQILIDQRKPELFFATFNFLHFHNIKDTPTDSGLRLIGLGGHDKFHFPLNFVFSVDPFNADIGFRVEYDKSYFNPASIRLMMSRYIDLLTSKLDA